MLRTEMRGKVYVCYCCGLEMTSVTCKKPRWCLHTAAALSALTNRVGLHQGDWIHPQRTWLVTCSATIYDRKLYVD